MPDRLKTLCLFVIITVTVGCAGSSKQARASAPEKSAAETTAGSFEKYKPYKRLSADFILKGKTSGQSLFYEGSIRVERHGPEQFTLELSLRDGVFRSVLMRMKVTPKEVSQEDVLHKKTEVVPLRYFKWVQIFGGTYPFPLFLPVLMGFPPKEFTMPQYRNSLKINKDKNRIRFDSGQFSIIGTLRNGLLESLYYRQAGKKEIVILKFAYGKEGKRVFPKELYIQRTGDDDGYIRMRFRRVRFRL